LETLRCDHEATRIHLKSNLAILLEVGTAVPTKRNRR
jgi:hypothetical protein